MSKGGTAPVLVFSDSSSFKHLVAELDANVRYVKSTILYHVDRSGDERLALDGTVDAYAELLLLSKASCIITSSSSFSGIAGAISSRLGNKNRCFILINACQNDAFDYFETTERAKFSW